MAENKKSIVVYSDWIKKFEALTDDEAGRLIKHFFRYVNDLNPVAPDRITELSFIDIEQSLKRDLKKWEKRAERSRENGKNGGRPPTIINPEKPKETQRVISEPEKPDSVIDSDIVNDKKVNSIVDRKLKFSQSLKPFLDLYGKDVLNDFYTYWSEPNKSNTKFKQELEKTWDLKGRLSRWAKSDFNKAKSATIKGATDQSQNKNLFAL